MSGYANNHTAQESDPVHIHARPMSAYVHQPSTVNNVRLSVINESSQSMLLHYMNTIIIFHARYYWNVNVAHSLQINKPRLSICIHQNEFKRAISKDLQTTDIFFFCSICVYVAERHTIFPMVPLREKKPILI